MTYLENISRNESMLTIMATATLLTSLGHFGWLSPMWWVTGRPAASISSHTALISVLEKSMTCPWSSMPGLIGMRKVFESQRLQLLEGTTSAARVPPIDQTDAIAVPA